MNKEHFLNQIKEDIKILQQDWLDRDKDLEKEEYAFNYWILSRLYNIDEELIPGLIVEYNDKNIDCYVHYEESKELFIIQNKFYGLDTSLSRKEVADFLTTPLTLLKNNKYTKSKELQKVFNEAYRDPDYKIWLHFYITNEKRNEDIEILFKNFNYYDENCQAFVGAKISYLSDIYDLYYGKNYKEGITFWYDLITINKGTVLKILPKDYQLEDMSEAYYIMTPIIQLYKMYKKALDMDYLLFEENIREYLGRNSINNGIIKTLKDPKDRKNFFYYNNGVTIICENTGKKETIGRLGYKITLKQPLSKIQ